MLLSGERIKTHLSRTSMADKLEFSFVHNLFSCSLFNCTDIILFINLLDG